MLPMVLHNLIGIYGLIFDININIFNCIRILEFPKYWHFMHLFNMTLPSSIINESLLLFNLEVL